MEHYRYLLRLPQGLARFLRQEAARRGVSIAALVRAFIAEGLSR